jgi:hypothetical protein
MGASVDKQKENVKNLSTVEKNRGQKGGTIEKHVQEERARIEEEEDKVTLDSDESFPASDPPSLGGVTGPEDVKKPKK